METPARDYQREFVERKAWGLLTSVDIHTCSPSLIRDKDAIRSFVIELCDRIEMKRFGEPVIVNFGQDERVAGFSLTQLIETSLISGHFANQTNNVYLDIFSCKYYNPDTVARFSADYFKGRDYTVHTVFRI